MKGQHSSLSENMGLVSLLHQYNTKQRGTLLALSSTSKEYDLGNVLSYVDEVQKMRK